MEKPKLHKKPKSVAVLLTKCPVDRLTTFCHGIIDKLLGQNGRSYEEFSDVWSLEEWVEVSDCIQGLCKECGRNSWEKEQIICKMETIPEKQRDALLSVCLVRENDLRRSLLNKTMALSGNVLQDFDWRLKLVMSSDKLASVQQSVVSVDLDIDTTDGNKSVLFEMDKAQLKTLLDSLEVINQTLMGLKT